MLLCETSEVEIPPESLITTISGEDIEDLDIKFSSELDTEEQFIIENNNRKYGTNFFIN